MAYKDSTVLLNTYDTEDKAREYFIKQRWPNGKICPHCGNHKKKIYAFSTNKDMFKCGACYKKFTVRTKTYMANSNIPYYKWLTAFYLVTGHKKGISSIQLATDLRITQKNAWFMIKRINHMLYVRERKLTGVVEVDETYYRR